METTPSKGLSAAEVSQCHCSMSIHLWRFNQRLCTRTRFREQVTHCSFVRDLFLWHEVRGRRQPDKAPFHAPTERRRTTVGPHAPGIQPSHNDAVLHRPFMPSLEAVCVRSASYNRILAESFVVGQTFRRTRRSRVHSTLAMVFV